MIDIPADATPRLRAYLLCEAATLALDEATKALADELRDAMDPLWDALTEAERAWLNARQIL